MDVDPPAAADSNDQTCRQLVESGAEPCVCGQLLPARVPLKLSQVSAGLIWVVPWARRLPRLRKPQDREAVTTAFANARKQIVASATRWKLCRCSTFRQSMC